MAKYRVEITQIIELSLEDGHDILERTQTKEWQNQFYQGMTEDEAVGMLAACIALDHQGLSQLDGWADLDDTLVQAKVVFEGLSWVEKEEEIG